MRSLGLVFGYVLTLLLAAAALWILNVDDIVRASIASGHLLDWVTGGVCHVWLLVILKVPWDLYFQAHTVEFELRRSKERGIPVAQGREEYVRGIRRKLGWFAVGAHVLSAALVA